MRSLAVSPNVALQGAYQCGCFVSAFGCHASPFCANVPLRGTRGCRACYVGCDLSAPWGLQAFDHKQAKYLNKNITTIEKWEKFVEENAKPDINPDMWNGAMIAWYYGPLDNGGNGDGKGHPVGPPDCLVELCRLSCLHCCE